MKRIPEPELRLMVATAEVRTALRELMLLSSTVPTSLLGPLCDKLTAALKARESTTDRHKEH